MKSSGRYWIMAFLAAGGVLMACGGGDRPSNTSGTVRIAVDETLYPVIEEELQVFQADYPEANVVAQYVSEQEAIRSLMLDSAKVAIVTRPLSEEELALFRKKYDFSPRAQKVAVDGVALILNKENQDTLLLAEQVRAIFRGEISRWEELPDGNLEGPIRIVFDNPYSSTIDAVKRFSKLEKLDSSRMVAARRNTEVIRYVERNPNALGVIGLNWISHPQDSAAQAFLESVNLVAIAPDEGKPGYGKYYKPYQAYLSQGFYPLVRDVYSINASAGVGVGTGFVSFLASERGQLIILRSGLLPVRQPTRLINIKE